MPRHRPDPGGDGASRAMLEQAAFHHGQEDAQHRALQGRVRLQEVTQPLGHGQDPLAHRQRWENVIDQVRRCFGHAPRVARGAHTATLAGVCDQEIVLALVAVGVGEAVSKDAAFVIAAEGSLDMGRRCFTVLAAGEFQPGFEVGLDDAIPQRPLGTAALVALGCGRGALCGGCHRGGPSWSGDRDRILYISSAFGRRSTAVASDSARRAGDAAQQKFRWAELVALISGAD